ncbi:MAG: acyltransferase, partial [Oscillospiraceae bacterium]
IVFFSITKLISFAVPAFIFTSALKLFYKYGDERKFTYPTFLWDRFRKIYMPYFIWVTVYYLVYVFIFKFFDFKFANLLRYILDGDLSAQFYFIILIIQFYLLMPIWILISRVKSTPFSAIIVAIAFAVTIGCRMFIPDTAYMVKLFSSYLIFWTLGMYAGIYYESFISFIERNKIIMYIGWFITAIAHCVLSYMDVGGLIDYSFEPLIVVFFCFFSMFGFYTYIKGLTETLESKGKGFLISISEASYDIYLLHCLIITSVYEILTFTNLENLMVRFGINFIATYTLSIVWSVCQATFYKNSIAKLQRNSARRTSQKARRKRYL